MSTSRIVRLAKVLGLSASIGACALLAGPVSNAHAAIAVYGAPVTAALTPKQRLAIATFKKAKQRFDAGDFAGALPLFRQADQLHPGGAPKYKIAQCLDKLGRNAEAVAAYKVFIDSNPGAKYKDRIIEAGQRITQLQASLPAKAKLMVTPAGIAYNVTVDGQPAQGPELQLSPGPHTIEVTAPNHAPFRQQVNARGGQQVTITAALQPNMVQPPPVPRGGGNKGLPFTSAGLAAGGLALGAGVATTVFGVQALGTKSDYDDAPIPTTEAQRNNLSQLADDTDSKALLSDVFLGVTGGLAIASGVLLVIGLTSGGKKEGSAAIPKVVPHVGTNGGGATIGWTF